MRKFVFVFAIWACINIQCISAKKKKKGKKKYVPEVKEGYDQPEHKCDYPTFNFGQQLTEQNSTLNPKKILGKVQALK